MKYSLTKNTAGGLEGLGLPARTDARMSPHPESIPMVALELPEFLPVTPMALKVTSVLHRRL